MAALLTGVPSYAGPDGAPATELCTPTGAALLTTLATAYGPQPAMTTASVGVGAGGRDPEGHANVLRLLVGSPVAAADGQDDLLVLETNVDDLDPRLWPEVITAVLAAGALDAWLTPILMKKGRPAHTFRALVAPGRAAEVRATVFRETTTIGIREYPVARHALPRETTHVTVDGIDIAVKVALLDGFVVTAQPEYDDVVRAAHALGRPTREVLAEASAAARAQVAGLMDLTALALTFGAIFVVELPDKTFLATLVLATKYRPILVWLGVGAAFAVQTTVAVLLGHAASFLPERAGAVGRAADVPRGRGDPRPRGAQPPAGLRRGVRRGRQERHRLPRRAGVVPRAVRRRVGRPVPAADDLAGRPLRGAGQRLRRRARVRCSW